MARNDLSVQVLASLEPGLGFNLAQLLSDGVILGKSHFLSRFPQYKPLHIAVSVLDNNCGRRKRLALCLHTEVLGRAAVCSLSDHRVCTVAPCDWAGC